MPSIPEPLRVVLRDFCHIEWYEVDELAQLVESGSAGFDTVAFESQLDELILSANPPLDEVNVLTSNEFESSDEMKAWLLAIRSQVFGR